MEISAEYREKQLELLKVFADCCEKNNIPYYLNGGTLLGAIRHKGFIPWDDDVDVAVFREDYQRLMSCLKSELRYPFVVQMPEELYEVYWGGFARIRNAESTAASLQEIVLGSNELCNGIWLDIQILDAVYTQQICRRLHMARIRFWQGLRLAKSLCSKYSKNELINNIKWNVFRMIAPMYSYERIDTRLRQLQKQCKEKKMVASLTLHKTIGENIVYLKEWFGEGQLVEFEGFELKVPLNYQAVLEKSYGSDYMELPEKEKRQSNHEGLILDAKRPYVRYRNLWTPELWKTNCVGKKIVLFGSGQQAQYFLTHEEEKYRPAYIVDNDAKKWGKMLDGIVIENPKTLLKESGENVSVIIANIYWEEISRQLDEMGIEDYYSYVNSQAWNE